MDFITKITKGRGPDVSYLYFRSDFRTVLFRKIEIVLWQRILGIVAASHHASTAVSAACTGRTLAAEVGIGDYDLRLAEIRADVGCAEGVPHAIFIRHFLEDMIGSPQFRVARRAQHPLRRFVMWS